MNLFRDDIQSLRTRRSGQSLVCASVISAARMEIVDQTGRMVLDALPSPVTICDGDVVVFLFNCYPDSDPKVQRVTVVPSHDLALYKLFLGEFRRREAEEAQKAAPTIHNKPSADDNILGFQF